MESSFSLSEDKKRNSSKKNNIQVLEEAKEKKYDPPTKNLDIINKNFIKNDNHSNNTGKIIKAKKNSEFENIISEKNIGKSIESLYILKYIFSFLSEKQKLKVIIYNKNLQKKLDKNIENYKRIRGVYKEGEKNGKGKEYYFDKLIFKGEYLNGKRNGKGKEYYDYGELKFKGEYLNGEKNGKGKEYYKNGKLEFEGEYLNGKRNGKVKEYDEYGELKFEGEYLNGEKNGKGKEYYKKAKLLFEGEYLNGKIWNGKGYNINGKTDFEIKEGNGKIKEYYENGELKFEGEYLNGEKNGIGKEYYDDDELLLKEINEKGKECEYDSNLKF